MNCSEKLRSYTRRMGLPLLLVASVAAAYSGIFSFSYLYDDEFLIFKNRFLDSFGNLVRIFITSSTGGAGNVDAFYRPMQILSYLAVVQSFGRELWAFHLLNIILHACNALLVYRLGSKLGLSTLMAFLAALLWSLHPLHTEAVTYMSGTADPLHTFFMLAGLNVVLPDFSLRRLAGAMGFFILALLSKEAAIVFPALLFTLLYFFAKRPWHWRTYFSTLPFWVVAFAYFILRRTWSNFSDDFTMYKQANVYTENIIYRFYTFLATLPSYLQLILWPQNLHMDRAFSVFVAFLSGPVLGGAIIVGFALMWGWKSRVAAWVGLWFFAAYVPESGVLIPVNALFLEHWMYVPTIGIFIGFGFLIELFIKSNSIRAVFGIIAALALGICTFNQNQVWKDPVTFFSNILKYNPRADRIRHNLAMAYSDRGDVDLALEQYGLVLKNTDQYPQTYHNMARLYLQKGHVDLAESYFLKAISLMPRFFPSYGALAELYAQKGDIEKASQYRRKYEELTR